MGSIDAESTSKAQFKFAYQAQAWRDAPDTLSLAICLALSEHWAGWQDGSSCFPAIETIAEAVKSGPDAVRRALTRCEQAGLLERIAKPGRSYTFRLLLKQPLAKRDPLQNATPSILPPLAKREGLSHKVLNNNDSGSDPLQNATPSKTQGAPCKTRPEHKQVTEELIKQGNASEQGREAALSFEDRLSSLFEQQLPQAKVVQLAATLLAAGSEQQALEAVTLKLAELRARPKPPATASGLAWVCAKDCPALMRTLRSQAPQLDAEAIPAPALVLDHKPSKQRNPEAVTQLGRDVLALFGGVNV